MKLKIALFVCSCFVLFFSCENKEDNCDEMVWDFVNHSVTIQVVDNEGNLLTEDVEFVKRIKVLYKENVYQYEEDQIPQLRDIRPQPLALRWNVDDKTISFGEFSPTRNYRDESFVIEWEDGSQDNVNFDLFISWKDCDPTVHRTVYLNGELSTEDRFSVKIVKP